MMLYALRCGRPRACSAGRVCRIQVPSLLNRPLKTSTGMNLKLLPLIVFIFVMVLLSPPFLSACGVLSHEELIDVCGDSDIKPALLKKFPIATTDELKQAHAYAYGSSVIQDIAATIPLAAMSSPITCITASAPVA